MDRDAVPTRVPVAAAIAAVAPQVVPLVAALFVLVGWLAGINPFWPTPDVNVAEAAAVRDHAEVVRLIEAGQDPNRRWPVRADIIDGDSHTMTPLEAAVEIRRLELVKLLVRHGASITPAARIALSERSAAHGASDIATYLAQLTPRQSGTSR
jgi:hypothetical protein